MFTDIDDEMDSYVESRGGIDQVQCYNCGRPIIIYCDDPRTPKEIICPRCKCERFKREGISALLDI